jgi:cell division protein FtsN
VKQTQVKPSVAQAPKSTPSKPLAAAKPADPQFDFYEMLPKFEVVIPEQDESTPAQPRGSPMQKAGVYILQAGSFRNNADAERVRALIALQGVQSKVQRVAIDRDTWYRVRIGPITDLRKLEDTRSKLRQAQIEALVIRVGG